MRGFQAPTTLHRLIPANPIRVFAISMMYLGTNYGKAY